MQEDAAGPQSATNPQTSPLERILSMFLRAVFIVSVANGNLVPCWKKTVRNHEEKRPVVVGLRTRR